MTAFTDNSAFHSAARCLEGTARPDSDDVANLLQFATLAVFMPTVAISAYELEFIDRANQFHEYVKSAGLRDVVRLQDYTANSYAESCAQAAESAELLVPNADFSFELAKSARFPTFSATSQRIRDALHKALIAESADSARDALRELLVDSAGLPPTAAYSVVYMLLRSDSLLDELRQKARSSWSPEQTHLASTWLKIELNHHLSKNAQGIYVPADARAKVWESQTKTLAQRLEKLVQQGLAERSLQDAAKDEVQPKKMGLPPVSTYLINESKGDPQGLLECTAHLRTKADLLRRDLEKIVEADPLSGKDRKMWDDLARAFSDGLSDSGPAFGDGITLVKIFGIPVPLPNRKFADWWRSVKARRRVAFLTNLALHVKETGIDERTFEKLRSNCTKNRK